MGLFLFFNLINDLFTCSKIYHNSELMANNYCMLNTDYQQLLAISVVYKRK